MPVPIPPRKITCESCGWTRVLPAGSDVIMPGEETPTRCPRCDGEALQVREMSWLEQVASPSILLAELKRRRGSR